MRVPAALLALTLITACATAPPQAPAGPQAPKAAQKPTILEQHGLERTDEYYWLRERENPEVIAYLNAENEYLKASMRHTEPLQQQLYQEIVARIPQRDESVPTLRDGYYYSTRFEEGKEYPIYVRRKGSLEGAEEVMLDVNALAAGQSYFAVAGVSVSSGNDILAYSTDNVGRRKYTLRFKNLVTGETLPDAIPEVRGMWPGPRTTGPSSTPASIRRRCARIASSVTSSAPTRPATRWSSKRPTRPSRRTSSARRASASS